MSLAQQWATRQETCTCQHYFAEFGLLMNTALWPMPRCAFETLRVQQLAQEAIAMGFLSNLLYANCCNGNKPVSTLRSAITPNRWQVHVFGLYFAPDMPTAQTLHSGQLGTTSSNTKALPSSACMSDVNQVHLLKGHKLYIRHNCLLLSACVSATVRWVLWGCCTLQH